MSLSKVGVVATLLLTGLIQPAAAKNKSTLSSDVEQRRAVEELSSRFLWAFENLDMHEFIRCFADDATVFFPIPEPPQRYDGKAAIQEHFEQVFAGIRKGSTASAPPYHHLAPQDQVVQLLGPDAALVSFHLRNAERVARRTLVLKKTDGKWLIEHLHGSNVSLAPGAPAADDAKAEILSKIRARLDAYARGAADEWAKLVADDCICGLETTAGIQEGIAHRLPGVKHSFGEVLDFQIRTLGETAVARFRITETTEVEGKEQCAAMEDGDFAAAPAPGC